MKTTTTTPKWESWNLVSVNKVAGLGSGEPFIEPEQPDEYKAELNINIDVFPWAVRNQDVELE